MTCYWDDLGLAEGYSARLQEGLLSEAEAEAVAELHEHISTYQPESPANHEAILDDPDWEQVVAAAKRAKASLLNLLSEPVERLELLRDEPEFP